MDEDRDEDTRGSSDIANVSDIDSTPLVTQGSPEVTHVPVVDSIPLATQSFPEVTDVSEVDSTPLDLSDDVFDVKSELMPVSANWKSIGIALRLNPNTLDSIQAGNNNDCTACLTSVVTEWLKRNYNVERFGEPTWRWLVKAVGHPAGGAHTALATDIARKHKARENQVMIAGSTPYADNTADTENIQQNLMGNGTESPHDESDSQQGVIAGTDMVKPLQQLQFLKIGKDELIFKIETRTIQGEFNSLFTKVHNLLEEKTVKLGVFVLFLENVPGYEDKSLFDTEIPDLRKAKDLTSVLRIVRNRCSWFNHSLLDDIIKTFCEGHERIEKAYKDYCTNLQRYCKQKFPIFNGVGHGGKEDEMLVLKVDRNSEETSLGQVKEIVVNIAHILKVSIATLHLQYVVKGCVQLTLLVPSYIPGAVFPLTTDQEVAMSEIGVIDLQCGTYHFSCKSHLIAQLVWLTRLLLSADGHELELFHTGGEMMSAALNLWVHYFFHPLKLLLSKILPAEHAPITSNEMLEHELKVRPEKVLVKEDEELKIEKGKKHRKLEIQQQSRLHPEKGHTSTDSTDVFILPQYIQVMVSNYQPLQTIFSIPEGECHTRPIKTDEQFSPTVTIVDAATQQPLDCVLLLHGEKPPEVNSRTLFCYIAVQVSYHDEHGSHPYPLYHMESKPCTQGNLPFIFSFHQPGTLCVIQLSIHSIVDSEGVEYMHHSEDCRCIVRIIDRKQHYCQSRTQHGAVRMKEPPRIGYTGPLATTKYHKIVKRFKQLYLSSKNEQITQLAKRIIDCSSISLDIKVDAMCWEAFVGILEPEHCKDSEKLFEAAMNKASQLDCQNSVLLQGMILKHLGYIQYVNCNDDEALKYISAARELLANAVPSQITAQVLFIGLMVKWRKILSTPQGMQDVSLSTSSLNKSIEGDYDLLLEHADFMEEYEQPDLFLFLTEKASFHLRSLIIEDKLPPKALHPSQDDIKKAEHCLNRISVDMLPNQVNPFAALYYRALSDLFLWKQKYSEAFAYAKWGKQLCLEGKIKIGIDIFTQRLWLLESLMLDARKKESEDEAIDEILKEFSGETVQP